MANVGIQVYTLRSNAQSCLMDTLDAIAEMGYDGVEFAGFYGNKVESVRRKLDDLSLSAFGAHVRLEEFRNDVDKVIYEMSCIGAKWALIPWLDEDLRAPETLTSLVSDFERYSQKLGDAGIRFGYHNHDFEFNTRVDEGRTVFDFLIDSTDPNVMFFELDPFWANVGGADPAEILRTHGDRIEILQLKDADQFDPKVDRPFGQGRLDWHAMFSECERLGINHFIVEQDYPNEINPLEDARVAIGNAREWGLISQQ